MMRLALAAMAVFWSVGLIGPDEPGAAKGGKYNEVLAIGAAAPAWSDLEGVDGRRHALADLRNKAVVVVVFTCNSCPAAVDYEERLLEFCRQHAGPESQVAVVAICVNTVKDDLLPALKQKSEAKGFPFAYLHDPSQKIAKAYGADKTPEFFVLDRQRRVAYMGAFDDRDPPAAATKHFLVDAVTAVLAGRAPEVTETNPRGCRIRWNDRRRP
ncbi:MAG TPA: thioredoxin family protein [Gemmatales bacterium]|nr:thioredoxin family protein [Gemmatales bacterium]HMP58895.1 thioredoxin family protein [Gemmatales bacterium]